MTTLVEQPNGAPTRKVFGMALVALGMVALNQTVPALIPDLIAHPAVAPLWAEIVKWAPMIVVAAGYQIKEWAPGGETPLPPPFQ